MKTYTQSQAGVIAEHKLKSNVNHKKERYLRILYTILSVGIILVVISLVFLFVK